MNTKDKTLQDCIMDYCGKDPLRPAMLAPVLINGFAYATDSHRAIRVPVSKVDFEVKENPEYPGIEGIWNGVEPTENIKVHIDVIKAALSKIKLVNDTQDCPECEGTGKSECGCCGHLTDCEDCDGDGGVEIPGKLVPNYAGYVMRIKDIGFNPRFIKEAADLIDREKDAYLHATALHAKKPCLFQSGGIELLLMPMMWGSEEDFEFLNLSYLS